MVYKRVRGWTSGQSLPAKTFVEYPPPPPDAKQLQDYNEYHPQEISLTSLRQTSAFRGI